MRDLAPIAVAIIAMIWCLYARRLAWYALGERPITLAVGLQTTAVLMLLPPLAVWLNGPLHAATGQWNVAGFVAHCLCLASDAAIAYHVAWRANWEEDFRRGFKLHVELPGTLAVGLMFALWSTGNGSSVAVNCFYLVPLDLATRAYWGVFCAALAWILVYAVRSMFKLRQDPRSRTTVTIYIAASCSGVLSLMLRITELAPSLNTSFGMTVASIFGCGAIVLFAVGAGRAWTRKARWLHDTANELKQIPTTKPAKVGYAPRLDAPPL